MTGAGSLHLMDSAECQSYEWWKFPVKVPADIDSIKYSIFSLNFFPIRYYSPMGDTIQQVKAPRGENMISIICGLQDGDSVFVVDENYNRDLTDDTVRTIHNFEWRNATKLIKCNYTVDTGDSLRQGHGWIQIGRSVRWGDIFQSTCQHMEAELQIDQQDYRLGVVDYNSNSFCFFRPQMALLEENGNKRDSLAKRDHVEKGEYIKLGDHFYKFIDFYSGDGTIILAREKDYNSMIGIQVGLKAPDFEFVSVAGDTVSSEDFKNKKILIANISGCTSSSYGKYREVEERFRDEMIIIGLESHIPKDLGGILMDTEVEFNEDMYNKYRNAYSSYNCYLIGEDGRIADMFDIFDWKSYLLD